jgi:hypothetical protein
MVGIDAFLTVLYVMVDDFIKIYEHRGSKSTVGVGVGSVHTPRAQRVRAGRVASLCCSEVVTLALFAQFGRFSSQHDFYRFATLHLRAAFPNLPHRSQFNRLTRHNYHAITAFALHLAQLLGARSALYEALDTSAVPTRNCKRRGAGWLPEFANIGYSNRLGWYEGFHLLMSVTSHGVITGWGFGRATSKDQPLAESFFMARSLPAAQKEAYMCSVGETACGPYVADTGFEGVPNHKRWNERYAARVICPPHPFTTRNRPKWSKPLRRWLSSVRQIVETVYDKIHNFFRLQQERPHTMGGFQTRLAARVGLHNFCIWLNTQLARPHLQFADLLSW